MVDLNKHKTQSKVQNERDVYDRISKLLPKFQRS